MMILSRTNLVKSQSKAKKCKEYDGGVGFSVAQQKPQKMWKIHEMLVGNMFMMSKHETLGIV